MDWLLPTSECFLRARPSKGRPPQLTTACSQGGGIDTYNIADPSAVSLIKTELFPANAETRPAPQDSARPHEAILDPTGDFLVFPDLGSDLLRVLHVDKATLAYTESVRIGSSDAPACCRMHGTEMLTTPTEKLPVCPRDRPQARRLLQVWREDVPVRRGRALEPPPGLCRHLQQRQEPQLHPDPQLHYPRRHRPSSGWHRGCRDPPLCKSWSWSRPYKPRLTCPQPDSKFLTLSSRLEKSLEYTIANGTTITSDPLITYSIDAASGALTHVQTAPAGGNNPRHFSFNKDGTLVASALQGDGRVVIFERDTASGKIGKTVAEANVVGMPNFVIFKE